ncbi:MAG: hypothetical protein ABIC18_02695 [Candidatus Omnitrophota bacterium]
MKVESGYRMNDLNKKFVIIAVLAVILIALVFNNLKRAAGKRTKKSPQIQGETVAPSVSVKAAYSADKKTINLQKERAESLAWGRDPFRYVESDDKNADYQASALVLKGISLGKNKNSFAFINNEITEIGDIVAGYEVLSIERDKVLLKKGQQSFYLVMPQEQ